MFEHEGFGHYTLDKKGSGIVDIFDIDFGIIGLDIALGVALGRETSKMVLETVDRVVKV